MEMHTKFTTKAYKMVGNYILYTNELGHFLNHITIQVFNHLIGEIIY